MWHIYDFQLQLDFWDCRQASLKIRLWKWRQSNAWHTMKCIYDKRKNGLRRGVAVVCMLSWSTVQRRETIVQKGICYRHFSWINCFFSKNGCVIWTLATPFSRKVCLLFSDGLRVFFKPTPDQNQISTIKTHVKQATCTPIYLVLCKSIAH